MSGYGTNGTNHRDNGSPTGQTTSGTGCTYRVLLVLVVVMVK